MIERAGALDVYFEDRIEILVQDGAAFREEAVKTVLQECEIGFSRIEKAAAL